MGYSLSWVAVRGKTADEVHADLGARPSGEANNSDRFLKDPILKKLSAKGELVACFVEEQVMYSAAMAWKAGRGVWSLCHDAEKGADHLEGYGKAPSQFDKINARLERAQKKDPEVDYIFDVPVELAKAITGFRHDEGDYTWQVLTKKRRR